jgi:hypothetical protein
MYYNLQIMCYFGGKCSPLVDIKDTLEQKFNV